MSASIPTPFNLGRTKANLDPLFDGYDQSDGGSLDFSGGDTTGNTKQGGGIPSNKSGVQFTVTTGKAGIRYYFNTLSNSLDFTETGEKRIFVFCCQANSVNRRQLSTASQGGLSLKMYSGTDTVSEIREWGLGGSDTALANRIGVWFFVVDPESTGSFSDTGSFDPSDILRYGHFLTQGAMIGNINAYWMWAAAVLISSEKTSNDIPRIYGISSSWQDLVDAVQGTTGFTGQNHVYVQRSGNTVNLFCPCAIGNASQNSPTQTTFNDSGLNVISPSSAESSDPRFHLTNDSMRVYLDLRNDSSDTATFSGTYTWGTQAAFDFSQSNSASITLSGAAFTGMGQFTCGSSVSGNATFKLGGTSKVIINGADLDGSTINGDTDVVGGTVTTFTNINVTGVLDFDTAGTYTNNGGTINEVTNSSGGNIIINNINGGVISTNAGSNITVLNIRNLSISGLSAGSTLRIYNTTTSSEEFNQVVAGTEYTATYSEGSGYSEGDQIEIRVSKIDKLEFKRSVIVGASGWSQLIEQQDNLTYNDYGVDGSTVQGISWDSGNMQFDFNDADNQIEGADIAAWYFYFITTAIGIREAFEAILWPQINIVTNRASVKPITFHNVKNTPLVIKNCWISRDDGVSIIANILNNSIQINPPTVFQVGLTELENKVQNLVDAENADIFVTPTRFTKKIEGTETVILEKTYTTDGQGTESLTEVT